ncbi:killer cell immunoglobulin-like receptor 3DL3 [Astatotilapia calliptera]|uniref:killer cell immunoglobulin-like receptor 3DL3 n=1 Tax=Astatotilapia calliptera TaxID=8154 RepID=UPI000E419376|nr:killer cell immunoglobulin-like receptor 3DL3 [Astatotilapia calliptera]
MLAANKPRATLTAQRSIIPAGGSVTLSCSVEGSAGWNFDWFRRDSEFSGAQKIGAGRSEHTISISEGGIYYCIGRRGDPVFYTEYSAPVTIQKQLWAAVKLQHNWSQIFTGETITLRCEIQGGEGKVWKYEWTAPNTNSPPTSSEYRISRVSVSHSGDYRCRGSSDYLLTGWSDAFRLTVSFPSKPTVTLQPSWTQIYSGETVTVRCEIQGGEGAQWTYEWRAAKLNTPPTSNEYRIIRATESDSGGYSCRGRRDYFFSEWSDIITLTVSYKPKAKLRADNTAVPVGGSVTLTCSVNPSSSSGWKYYWYRDEKSSEALTTQDAVFHSNGQISVSQEGLYRCRGGRGNPVYYTEDSQSVRMWKTVAPSGPERTSCPVWLVVGLVCGVSLLLILLLLMYRYRKAKDLCFTGPIQSDINSQDSTRNHGVNQDEIQDEYKSLHPGDHHIYETIQDLEDTAKEEDESPEATYSLIEVKDFGMERKHHKPHKSIIYTDVNMGTAGQ